jgi:hypothetical protein
VDIMQPTQNSPAAVDMTPADALRSAALYLDAHGWIQCHLYTFALDTFVPTEPFPSACAAGAIAMTICGRAITYLNRTDPERELFDRTVDYFEDYLTCTDPIMVDGDYDPSVTWNDADRRTAKDVIATLTRCRRCLGVHHGASINNPSG